jgi:6-phosphofructokinase 2
VTYEPFQIEGWTRESYAVFDSSTDQQYRFSEPGPEMSQTEWRGCLDTVAERHPRPDYLVASGSLPPGVPEDFYARLARFAGQAGIRMILDASGGALNAALAEGVFLVKPNLRELNHMAGQQLEHEADQVDFAKTVVADGKADVVVVSLGAAGVLMVDKGTARHLRAPTVSIKSKVGAGDSMVGGITLGLARSNSPLEAVQLGLAAGAAAVMTPGTELCRKADVDRLFERVRSERAQSDGPN